MIWSVSGFTWALLLVALTGTELFAMMWGYGYRGYSDKTPLEGYVIAALYLSCLVVAIMLLVLAIRFFLASPIPQNYRFWVLGPFLIWRFSLVNDGYPWSGFTFDDGGITWALLLSGTAGTFFIHKRNRFFSPTETKSFKPILAAFILLTALLAGIYGHVTSIGDRLGFSELQKNTAKLDDLLKDPLNARNFLKAKKFEFNSGGYEKKNYLFRPSHRGFYYVYFLFDQREGGPELVTYKAGQQVDQDLGPGEELIQVFSDRADRALSKCDLVGKSRKAILDELGHNFIKKDNLWAYQGHGRLLILKLGNKVEWFKILRTSRPFQRFQELEGEEGLLSGERGP